MWRLALFGFLLATALATPCDIDHLKFQVAGVLKSQAMWRQDYGDACGQGAPAAPPGLCDLLRDKVLGHWESTPCQTIEIAVDQDGESLIHMVPAPAKGRYFSRDRGREFGVDFWITIDF